MTQHTKTPWTVTGNMIFRQDNSEHIATTRFNEDAAFIARACNRHEALVAALEAVTQQLTDLRAAIVDQGLQTRFVDDSINMLSEGETAINNAKAALDAARGKQ